MKEGLKYRMGYNKHIEIGEMIEFLCSNSRNVSMSKFLKMSSKVNSHIYKCQICKRKYYMIQENYEKLQKNKIDDTEIKERLYMKYNI